MSSIEWISPYVAVQRLESMWNILSMDAEQIVRNVIESGRVEVRGAPDRWQQVPQIATGKVNFYPNSLSAWNYFNLELDWNGLVEEGRKLIPSGVHVPSIINKRSSVRRDRAAQTIRDLWPEGVPNPKQLPNGELCKLVSDKIAEDNRQQGLPKITISDDTILRAAGRQH